MIRSERSSKVARWVGYFVWCGGATLGSFLWEDGQRRAALGFFAFSLLIFPITVLAMVLLPPRRKTTPSGHEIISEQ